MQQVTNFTLTALLHEGMETLVYEGHRDSDGLPIVAKIAKAAYPTPRELARLRNEFSILRALPDAHVARAVALEPCGNKLALILERIPARPLSARIQPGGMDIESVLRMGLALARLLGVVHQAGVIHKDIKPQNILVEDRSDQVWLIDFGIAARLEQDSSTTAPVDSLEGTLSYISPEQTGRMNRSVGHRTDFYSLGVTLYEMLTGELPFHGSDAGELVHSHIARIPISPEQRRPEIPAQLAALVMKLLAKDPEDRYQGAAGLALDLEECLAQWQSNRQIQPFPLGRKDVTLELQFPQKLVGREDALARLLSAFTSAREGAAELLLLSGPPGIGKSSLVSELQPTLTRLGGSLVAGKYDQLNRSVPFVGFVQAFRSLARQLLGQSPEILSEWKRDLQQRLGSNGRLLTDLVPDLELVIGPQPEVSELGASEAQNRFGLVLQNFVRGLCTRAHPLVIHLDDLQWADAGSLWLLQTLLMDPARGRLLIIASYRSNEVDAGHPLRTMLDRIAEQGVVAHEITVGPLDRAGTCSLLAATLRREPAADLEKLTDLALAKTHGNPFFLRQFLGTLTRRKLLWVDTAHGTWCWDPERIAGEPLTDNVIDFIAEQLQTLPAATQRALSVAACVGYQFDRATATNILGVPPAEVASSLWPALRAAVILPVATEHVEYVPADSLPTAAEPRGVYRFVHDRTRLAARQRLAEVERARLHLEIGRHLRAQLHSDSRPELLFETVSQLNAGAGQLQDAGERLDLVELNHRAARLARGSTAYAAAASFLRTAWALLDVADLVAPPALSFSVQRDLAESLYQCGEFAESDQFVERLLSAERTGAERAELLALRMMLYTSQGRFEEGMHAGLAGLALLGIELPTTPESCQAAFMAEVAAIQQHAASHSWDQLLQAGALQQADKVALLQLMVALTQPTYQVAPPLAALLIAKQVSFSLTHGNVAASAYGYVAFGLILAGLLHQYEAADRFGRLALALVERHGYSEVACKVRFMYAIYAPFKHPLRESLAEFERAQQIGLDTGDLFYGSLAFSYYPLTQLRLGDSLDAVQREITRSLAAMLRTRDQINTGAQKLFQQVALALAGQTAAPTSLDSAQFSESEWLARMDAMHFGAGRCLFHLFKLQLAYLYGDYAAALPLADGAEQSLASSLGMHWTMDLPFYTGLVCAALLAGSSPPASDALRTRLAACLTQARELANACPANARHRLLLLEAEQARAEGNRAQALDLFEQAVTQAKDSGFLQEEALANELCGRFYLSLGRNKVAAVYLSEARYGFARWGATAKVRQLSEKYSAVLADSDARAPGRGHMVEVSESTSTVWMHSRRLDMDSALKAAQAISSEIVLDKVLSRVMQVVLSNAGAQRGFLVLERDGGLWIEAMLSLGSERSEVSTHTRLEDHSGLATSVVRYVARSHELILLGDASRDPRFASDPYVLSQQPKSILCTALLSKGRLSGVLYLENNASADAFTSDRVELLRILSSQAATSLENGLLYSNLQATSEQLQRANDTLEQQVAQRTAQLSKALQDLWSEMDLARKIQTVLLPTQLQVPGYSLAARMLPAANVGGDYFDCFRAAGADWVLLGDVSGHGITAGLCMMMVQTAVRSVVATLQKTEMVPSPSEVLALVNSALHSNLASIGRDQYMTIMAFCFREGRVTYAGQHQDLLVYRAATQTVEQIETRGVWIGVLPQIDDMLPEDRLELGEGDILLLYTDGITEARRGKRSMLRTSGLAQIFRESCTVAQTSDAILGHILDLSKDYVVNDDLTLLVVKRQGQESSRE